MSPDTNLKKAQPGATDLHATDITVNNWARPRLRHLTELNDVLDEQVTVRNGECSA